LLGIFPVLKMEAINYAETLTCFACCLLHASVLLGIFPVLKMKAIYYAETLTCFACCLLHATVLLDFLFNIKDVDDTFLSIVG
jgi:hypothetical protein